MICHNKSTRARTRQTFAVVIFDGSVFGTPYILQGLLYIFPYAAYQIKKISPLGWAPRPL